MKRQRMPADQRRTEVVAAAYALMAEQGLAGFRTRLVAAKAGINQATLHHYFPTKADLVRAVVDRMLAGFAEPRGPVLDHATGFERIVHELADITARVRETPELFVVLAELAVAGVRDPELRPILRGLDDNWREWLLHLLRAAVDDGTIRADLDLDACATVLMVQFKGLTYGAGGPTDELVRTVEQVASQLRPWLVG